LTNIFASPIVAKYSFQTKFQLVTTEGNDMKDLRLYLLSGFVILFFTTLFNVPAFAQCGVERWSVKTGTDADVGQVNLNSTSNTTISYLDGLTAPNPIPANNRVAPTETTVWVISATLTSYKLESDSDYHLVLDDGAGHTMIAEIPSPSCVSSSSPFASGISHARSQFDAVYTATTSFQTANVPVQITGVGMFDFLHGQTGVAPNGIELHPIINIIFNPSTSSDFSLSTSPQSLSVTQGASGSATVTTTASGSFNSAVALSATGVPAGVSMNFNPASIAAPGTGSSTATVSVSSTATAGSYPITITGTGGGKTHTANLNLTIMSSGGGGGTTQLLGNPGFENGSSSPSPWTVSSGIIDNSTGEAAHSGSWKAWLNGYGSAHTDTLSQTVTIPSNATGATLSFWLHIDTAETTTTSAYDTLTVQLRNASGTVLTTLATYSNLNANTGYRQVSFDVTAYKGQTVQIYLKGAEDSQLQTSFVVDDFALNANSSGGTDTIAPTVSIGSPANGATVSGTTNVSATAADNVGVTKLEIYIDGALKTSNTNATTLTYSWNTTTAANGSHTVTAKAYDAAGNVGTSSTVTVTVSNSTGGTTTQLISNGGFESTLSPWILGGAKTPILSTARIHTGSDSLRAGATTASGSTEPSGDSWAYQTVTIPANATFWYSTATTDTIQYDWQEARILDSSGNTLQQIFKVAANNSAWTQQTVDLKSYAGKTIRIYFNCHGDGATDPTTLWVDDVSVKVTQ